MVNEPRLLVQFLNEYLFRVLFVFKTRTSICYAADEYFCIKIVEHTLHIKRHNSTYELGNASS